MAGEAVAEEAVAEEAVEVGGPAGLAALVSLLSQQNVDCRLIEQITAARVIGIGVMHVVPK